jgi:uncharacterized protein
VLLQPGDALAIDATGADVNATTEGKFPETPLHWAASTDHVDVADTLIDLGANLEAQGASIAGGPPLDDAVGYRCWQVAQVLVRRGARVDRLWHASALGLLARLDELCATHPRPSPTWKHAGIRSAAGCASGARGSGRPYVACSIRSMR